VVWGDWLRPTKPIQEIQELAEAKQVRQDTMTQHELRTLTASGNHQGVAIEVGLYPYVGLDSLLHDIGPESLFLVLDHLEDVHNVGALLRTAEAVGAAGVVLPKDRAAGVTPAAVRASAGASEHMRVARVTNLAQAIRSMKDQAVTVVGLEADDGAMVYNECTLAGPLALVVGSEGHGMKRLVREACDGLIRIPLHGHVTSLNASVAGGIVLYELRKQLS
jgi:23S rRNA (guanosine2251-2'-O)-methyltransferase